MRDKSEDVSKTMKFCFDQSNWTHPPSASAYIAPIVAHRLPTAGDDHQTLAKGCMKWNTDK